VIGEGGANVSNGKVKTLKEWRESRSMTQSELAELLKVGPSTVSMWETGDRSPSLTRAKKVATFFKTTVESIFFGKDAHEVRAEGFITDDQATCLSKTG
jgi:putative transcriptional regulator